MIDPKLLKHDKIHETTRSLLNRGYRLDINSLESLESKRQAIEQKTQRLQAKRNTYSKQIASLKLQKQDSYILSQEVRVLNDEIKVLKESLGIIKEKIMNILYEIPNLPDEEVPAGRNEKSNLEVRKWGHPRNFDFKCQNHLVLSKKINGIDLKIGSKIAGARFVVLYKEIAQLQRSLIQFMIDLHTKEHGYNEVYVPYLVNEASLFGTGQLPKFSEDLFHTQKQFSLSLIPTAEVPITNIVRDEIVSFKSLPLKFVGHTPCFRSEAGSYGKKTQGLIRQHQFEKVEMVQIVSPDKGLDALEELTSHAENVLKKLELPYRVIMLCRGEIGFSARKTYDLEVWLPSEKRYREISSCSWCGDFQARRMKAKFKMEGGANKKLGFLHTLNGSGLAVGRTLVAVLENYQQEDGSIIVPKVLQKYMTGLKIIRLYKE